MSERRRGGTIIKVINYIREHGLEALKENLGIVVRQYPDRIVLNYSQIDSPKFDPIVRECRGLILSWPDLRPLCVSFERFYNYGEDPRSAEFPIERAVVCEKVDGSLMSVYHDGDQWQVATRGMAFAEGPTSAGNRTFRDVFEKALGGKVEQVFAGFPEDWVYVFEMTSPETRVVKSYDACLYPLMIKQRDLGLDLWGMHAAGLFREAIPGWSAMRFPRIYTFCSFDEIMTAIRGLDKWEEGYVCVASGNDCLRPWRIKIKSPQYLAIARLRGNGPMLPRQIIDLIRMGEHDEYLLSFPEDRPAFVPYVGAINHMLDEVWSTFEPIRDIEDQKEFALLVKDLPAASLLFQLRKGRTLGEAFDGMSDKRKEALLGHYMDKNTDTSAQV